MRAIGDRIVATATSAASLPVTLADMKLHLRIDGSGEDDLVDAYLSACASAIGFHGELGRPLVQETIDESFHLPSRDVYLSAVSALALTSVTYYDTDNVIQTANLSDFELYSSSDWSLIRSENWPATYDRPDAITVRYTAGYADVDAVPDGIKQAIKLIVAHWYQNRENAAEKRLIEIPYAAAHLLGMHRVAWYG